MKDRIKNKDELTTFLKKNYDGTCNELWQENRKDLEIPIEIESAQEAFLLIDFSIKGKKIGVDMTGFAEKDGSGIETDDFVHFDFRLPISQDELIALLQDAIEEGEGLLESELAWIQNNTEDTVQVA
ncbi:hypothetical protein ACFL35_17310 [Candidatus Riflebacteria bacterium]